MERQSSRGVLGATLIGIGFGLTAMGIALVIPACTNWSLDFAERALKKSREGVGSAADVIGEFAGRASHHFGEATKVAKTHTAKAAGVVESAARHVREYAS